MIRFVCPRCKAVLEQPETVAGTTFACPSCGQRLEIPPQDKPMSADPVDKNLITPAVPATPGPPPQPPPLPFITADPNLGSKPSALPAPLPARPRSRRRDLDYDDEDDDFPSIERRSSRRDHASRGRYSQEAAAKAASSGLVCSLISLAMLLVAFLLWVLTAQGPRVRFAGEGEFVVVILFVVLGSFVLALLAIVFSSRGLDESNSYNRGQAAAGLICGIISMVISTVVGLFFLCAGMFVWSMVR
jgi:hypothetical protein